MDDEPVCEIALSVGSRAAKPLLGAVRAAPVIDVGSTVSTLRITLSLAGECTEAAHRSRPLTSGRYQLSGDSAFPMYSTSGRSRHASSRKSCGGATRNGA